MTETQKALPRQSALAAVAKAKWPVASLQIASTSLLILLLALVAARIWVAGHMDFETDEAYYWLWSRHLAISYFDHPPVVAYLVRLGTAVFGDTILGVRSMAIVAMIVATALLYALTVILFGERRLGLLAALWFSTMPLTTFFSIIIYPDVPQMLFWVLSCVGLALVWQSGRGAWWYLVGAAMGLLLLSKYTGVFLLFGVVAWLAVAAEMRSWLRRREPYVAALIALILFSPVMLWNAREGWASFIKQFGRAVETSPDGGLANMAGFVGVQAAFVSPLIFAFCIAGVAAAAWRGWRRQEANWLLLALSSAPMLLYFAGHALSAEVLAQWPSAAYPTAVVAAVAAFAAPANRTIRRALLRYSFGAAPWLGLALTLFMCAQMTLRPVSTVAARDPLSRFAGWAELAADARAAADAQHAGYIATSDYATNATLAFYLRDIPVFQTSEAIRYVFLPPLDQSLLARTTGIYVAESPLDDLERLRQHFDSVELIATIWRARDGDPIEPYRVYALKGYRGGLPFETPP
jgi:4-amino-4-deoxy-L-arabinose transferase-like glycosyltransferase